MKNDERRKAKIVFVHLDLGIGGAEQLILNLAAASQDAGLDVTIITSRCSQDHCFSQVKKPNGRLSRNVRVWGRFLPANILGVGTALCSTIRLLYLSFWTAKRFGTKADILVLDVLPTPIPFLTTWCHSGILYYCHFPDKLLTRDTVNGEQPVVQTMLLQQQRTKQILSSARGWYRSLLDEVEENSMGYADVLVANSEFTKSQIQRVFPLLANNSMKVLYPALDMKKFAPPVFEIPPSDAPIVSLNRFERKKNIELLLQAYAMLQEETATKQLPLPPLVVAGGYDIQNVENVEYLQELKKLALGLGIRKDRIRFRPSVSDEERATLMQTALCVVYTPHLEHFGIVPLEAMYAGRPVVAVASGGPLETILDDVTGFLCEPNCPEAFCQVLLELVENPSRVPEMGKAGHEHVKTAFGWDRFQKQWLRLVLETMETGKARRLQKRRGYYVWRSFYYLIDAMLTFVVAVLLTFILRQVGVLAPNQHIVGFLREAFSRQRDEL